MKSLVVGTTAVILVVAAVIAFVALIDSVNRHENNGMYTEDQPYLIREIKVPAGYSLVASYKIGDTSSGIVFICQDDETGRYWECKPAIGQ